MGVKQLIKPDQSVGIRMTIFYRCRPMMPILSLSPVVRDVTGTPVDAEIDGGPHG